MCSTSWPGDQRAAFDVRLRPPGNGKTVISQAIRNLLEGEIAIPHAIEVEGSIIRIFDPVIHEPMPTGRPAPAARWRNQTTTRAGCDAGGPWSWSAAS